MRTRGFIAVGGTFASPGPAFAASEWASEWARLIVPARPATQTVVPLLIVGLNVFGTCQPRGSFKSQSFGDGDEADVGVDPEKVDSDDIIRRII